MKITSAWNILNIKYQLTNYFLCQVMFFHKTRKLTFLTLPNTTCLIWHTLVFHPLYWSTADRVVNIWKCVEILSIFLIYAIFHHFRYLLSTATNTYNKYYNLFVIVGVMTVCKYSYFDGFIRKGKLFEGKMSSPNYSVWTKLENELKLIKFETHN